jgi:hypothetical protein
MATNKQTNKQPSLRLAWDTTGTNRLGEVLPLSNGSAQYYAEKGWLAGTDRYGNNRHRHARNAQEPWLAGTGGYLDSIFDEDTVILEKGRRGLYFALKLWASTATDSLARLSVSRPGQEERLGIEVLDFPSRSHKHGKYLVKIYNGKAMENSFWVRGSFKRLMDVIENRFPGPATSQKTRRMPSL